MLTPETNIIRTIRIIDFIGGQGTIYNNDTRIILYFSDCLLSTFTNPSSFRQASGERRIHQKAVHRCLATLRCSRLGFRFMAVRIPQVDPSRQSKELDGLPVR